MDGSLSTFNNLSDFLRSGSDGAFKRLLAAAYTGQLKRTPVKRFRIRYDSHVHIGIVYFDVVTVLVFRFVNIEGAEEGCDDEPQLHGFKEKSLTLKESSAAGNEDLQWHLQQTFRHKSCCRTIHKICGFRSSIFICSGTYLLPNPYAMIRLSSFSLPFESRNRSGLNVNGSGYLVSSCVIAHMFPITIVPRSAIMRSLSYWSSEKVPRGMK